MSWSELFLAVIAAATLLMALVQVGAIVFLARMARQAQDVDARDLGVPELVREHIARPWVREGLRLQRRHGVVDVVGPGTPLCEPGNPESVADAIEDAIRLPIHTVAKALCQRQRCHAMFTAERMVAQWMSLYGTVAAREDAAA